jgi:hypothetical protein
VGLESCGQFLDDVWLKIPLEYGFDHGYVLEQFLKGQFLEEWKES